jgi:hypothetical protein
VGKPLVLSQQVCDLHTIGHCTRPALAWLTTSVLVFTLILMPHPGSAQENLPPKFVTGLLDLPLSDYHLTPRGLIVENSGVMAQPRLNLFFNLYESDGPVDKVTGMVGILNYLQSKQRGPSSSTVENWNEMDLLSSLSVTFLKDWTFAFAYEYWLSPINNFPSASHIELKLGYHDHFLKGLGDLSLNPYFNTFVELVNKTADANLNDGEGHYFELGMVPRYVFAGYPLSIELPTYVTFPSSHYYDTMQPDGTPIAHSTVGVFGTGVRVTAPLTFINWRYGRWSAHADFIYEHLFADGVVFDNINFLPPPSGDAESHTSRRWPDPVFLKLDV